MIYDYKCGSCEHKFVKHLKMDDRKLPTNKPCPSCGVDGEVKQLLGVTATVSGVSSRDTRPEWFKSRLKDIKNRSGKDNTMGNVI